MFEHVNILGCNISNLSLRELLEVIYSEIHRDKDLPSIMLSANIHSVNLANQLSWLKDMLNQAEIVRNDSAGLQLAGKILQTPIKERMTWADFGWDLAAFCDKKNISLFFLGNRPGIAELAKERMSERHSNLKILGTHHGYFDINGEENEQIINFINQHTPDILIVGLGMPLQEKWILNNREKLHVGLIMTGGNCFTFLAGEETRAPEWMHKNGLEWLYRFIKEPKRMFKRYMIGNPLFIFRVCLQYLGRKY